VTFAVIVPADMASTWTLAMLPSPQDFSNLLAVLYDAASDPILWSPFLERVAKARQATSAAMVVHDFQQPLCTVSTE